MPTYVYRCRKGHTFELFHAISDDGPKRCPECRSGAKRVPAGGSGLLFRGSGFYITDYRSKGYKESASKEGGSGSAKPTSGSKGAEGSAASGTSGDSGGGKSGGTGGDSGAGKSSSARAESKGASRRDSSRGSGK